MKTGLTGGEAISLTLREELGFQIPAPWLARFLETYSLEFVILVFGLVHSNSLPDRNDFDLIKANTKLIPPNLQTRLSLPRLIESIRSVTPPDRRPTERKIHSLLHLFNEHRILFKLSPDLLQEVLAFEKAANTEPPIDVIINAPDPESFFVQVYPFRTAKDKNIRRCRFRDVRDAYIQAAMTKDLSYIMVKCRNSLDYVAVCNILWYHFFTRHLHSPPVLTLANTGCLSHGLDHFIATTKLVNDLVKGCESDLDETVWGEMTNLAGFRNLPFEGFDLKAEMEKLTKGTGFDRVGLPGINFMESMISALDVNVPHVDYISFRDYVLSGMWITSGATQFVTDRDPHLKFEWAGEKVKVKTGKNCVYHLFDLNELAVDAAANCKQRNSAISKCETAKIRLAVASDMETYLQQSWVVHLCGGAYRGWPGVTLEETPEDTIRRELEMLEKMRGRLSMPFDYKGFDNQPSLAEVVAIWKKLAHLARENVPPAGHAEFDEIVSNVSSGFYDSTLSGLVDGKLHVCKVLWSLMSGLRITSIVGNGWNSGITSGLVCKNVERWTGHKIEHVAVQGDDTHLIHKNWAVLMLCKMIYDAVGAESAEAKFKIGTNGGYLRRVFERPGVGHEGRTKGYIARSVVAWTQRKPWSDGAWSPFAQLSSQWEAISTIRQRGGCPKNTDIAWSTIIRNWSRTSGIDSRWVNVPTDLGGAGIGDWEGWIPSRPLEAPSVPPGVLPQSKFGARIVTANWLKSGIILSEQEAQGIAQNQFSQLVSGFRLPAIDRLLRDEFNKRKSASQVQWMRRELPDVKVLFKEPDVTPSGHSIWLKSLANTFGSRPDVMVDWLKIKALAVVRGHGIMQTMRTELPILHEWLKVHTPKGVSIGDVIDWYGGKLPFCNTNSTAGRTRGWAIAITAHNLKKIPSNTKKTNFKTLCAAYFKSASKLIWATALAARVGCG